MHFKVVVLPQPEGPSSATDWPLSTVSEGSSAFNILFRTGLGSLEELAPVVQHLDEEILAAGRRLTDVRRVFNAIGRKIQPVSDGFLIGPPEQWVEDLTRVVLEFGFDTLLYGDREATVEQLHVFAEKVIPGVRSNVAAARAGTPVARTA